MQSNNTNPWKFVYIFQLFVDDFSKLVALARFAGFRSFVGQMQLMFSRDKFGQRNRFRQRDIYITKQKIALDNFLGLKWIPKCFKTWRLIRQKLMQSLSLIGSVVSLKTVTRNTRIFGFIIRIIQSRILLDCIKIVTMHKV